MVSGFPTLTTFPSAKEPMPLRAASTVSLSAIIAAPRAANPLARCRSDARKPVMGVIVAGQAWYRQRFQSDGHLPF